MHCGRASWQTRRLSSIWKIVEDLLGRLYAQHVAVWHEYSKQRSSKTAGVEQGVQRCVNARGCVFPRCLVMTNTPTPLVADARPPFDELGSYQLLSKIGGGGMGSVYLARHIHLNRIVALKMLAPRWHDDSGALARFKQEMKAIGSLKHPNIIAATDAGEDHGCLYLVMEYVEGVDLGRLLRQRGRLAVADACEAARQTATALGCVAEHGLVHRDVKPSNLLLGRDGMVRLLDLGLARLQQPTADEQPLTQMNDVMGTADFIAPEQGLASHNVDIRADIYSLGCTLYTLLAGKPPFSDPSYNNFLRKVRAHQETPPPPIGSQRPDLPKGLSDLLERMMAKDPRQRLESPAETMEALKPYAAGHDLQKLLPEREAAAGGDPSQASTMVRENQTRSFQEQRPPSTTLRPQRGWPWLFAVLPLALAAMALIFWLAVFSPKPTTAVTNPPSNPEKREPGVWYDLLDKPPKEVLWPVMPEVSQWNYSPETGQLKVDCVGLGCLELAEVEDTRFDLELTLYQIAWVGGMGVFFRGRETPADLQAGTWADVLYLERFDLAPDREHPRLWVGYLRRQMKGQRPSLLNRSSELIARPDPLEHRLSITVGPSGLEKIFWDDKAVGANLCKPELQIAPRVGAGGSVGLMVQSSNVVVRAARLRLHPRTGE